MLNVMLRPGTCVVEFGRRSRGFAPARGGWAIRMKRFVALAVLVSASQSVHAGSFGSSLFLNGQRPSVNLTIDLGDKINLELGVHLCCSDGFYDYTDTWSDTLTAGGGTSTVSATARLYATDPVGTEARETTRGSLFIPKAGVFPIDVLEEITTLQCRGTGCSSDSFSQQARAGQVTVYENPGANPYTALRAQILKKTGRNPKWKTPLKTVPIFGVRAQVGITSPNSALASLSPVTNSDNPIYIDPVSAYGFTYQVDPGDPNFASFLLPVEGDNEYVLHLLNGMEDVIVNGGVRYQFAGDGVNEFTILGIEHELADDLSDPNFIVGLTFFSDAADIRLTDTVVTMTALTTPIPSSVALLGSALTGLALARIRRSKQPYSFSR